MKKGLFILFFISIYSPLFAQHIVEKSIESFSDKIEIYLDKVDNVILKSDATHKVRVKLSDAQEAFSNIKLVKEKGSVIIRSNNPLPNQNVINKFCVEQVNFASFVITVPQKSSIYINIVSGNLLAKNFEGNINAEIETGEVSFKNIKGNIKLSIVDGDVKVKIKKASLNLKSNLGIIFTNIKSKNLKIQPHKIEGVYKDSKQSVIIKAIKANIYLDAVKD
ncbi:MAG: hypothetical protein QM486_11150 [Flavobacteriaceae bacterium]